MFSTHNEAYQANQYAAHNKRSPPRGRAGENRRHIITSHTTENPKLTCASRISYSSFGFVNGDNVSLTRHAPLQAETARTDTTSVDRSWPDSMRGLVSRWLTAIQFRLGRDYIAGRHFESPFTVARST